MIVRYESLNEAESDGRGKMLKWLSLLVFEAGSWLAW